MIIKHEDMVALKYCNRGSRAFAARHKLNWQVFVQQGIDSSTVDHIDDEMMRRVIEHARLREAREQGES